MRAITVDKAALATKLTENMQTHHEHWHQAMGHYEAKVREWFEVNLSNIIEGKWAEIQRSCPYPVPEDHTDDYERVLDMLKWDLGNTYELSEGDFDQYVNDNWGWQRSFAANTMSYLVTGDGA